MERSVLGYCGGGGEGRHSRQRQTCAQRQGGVGRHGLPQGSVRLRTAGAWHWDKGPTGHEVGQCSVLPQARESAWWPYLEKG